MYIFLVFSCLVKINIIGTFSSIDVVLSCQYIVINILSFLKDSLWNQPQGSSVVQAIVC